MAHWTITQRGRTPGRRIGFRVRTGLGSEPAHTSACMTMAYEALRRANAVHALDRHPAPAMAVSTIPRRRMQDSPTVRIVARWIRYTLAEPMVEVTITEEKLDREIARCLAAYAKADQKPKSTTKPKRQTTKKNHEKA